MNHRDPLYIYILARGHSGSTMLELLLNRNKNLASMGEIDMLGLQIFRGHYTTRWVGQCSCEKRPMDCPVWGAVINQLKTEKDVDLVKNPLSWPVSDIGLEEEFGWKKPTAVLRYRFHRIARTLIHRLGLTHTWLATTYKSWASNRDFIARSYAHIREVKGVVDASKDPLQILELVRYSQLPIKVIYLTRDVRGLVWSALRKGRVKTAHQEAIDWTRQNQRILKHLDLIPSSSWMHIHYEDICTNVDSALARIHDFIGIHYSEMSSSEEHSRRHTIAGNRTRFRSLDVIKEDRSWEKNLKAKDIASIRRYASSTAVKLGYDI